MKNPLSLLPIVLIALIVSVTACEDSVTDPGEQFRVETRVAEDIPANPGAERGAAPDFTFYNLEEGTVVADEDSASALWDIAFNATTIIVNNGDSGPGEGGALVLDVPFEEVSIAPSEGYKTDQNGKYAINEWYNYTGNSKPMHAIIPIENKTIVLKTGDGEHYAKIQILSYYKGNPDTSSEEFANSQTRPPSRYYTFEYAIQLNGSRELK